MPRDEVTTNGGGTTYIKWPVKRPTKCRVTVTATLDLTNTGSYPDVVTGDLTYNVYASR